jgi:subtilisin family serine protease
MPMKVCVGYWEMMIARAQAGIPGFLPVDAGGCSVSQITNAITAATDAGANVINLSLGGDSVEPTVRDALNYAVQHGVFVAISMGNDFEDGNPIEFPSSYARDIAGVMAVGATGKSNTRAYYSSTGNYCEIAAPGGSSRDGTGNDRFIWQVTLDFNKTDPTLVTTPRFDSYAIVGINGTSMASPHVAATAALIMSQSPGISPAAVETLIEKAAKDLGPTGRDDQYGFGLLQAGAALRGQGIAK